MMDLEQIADIFYSKGQKGLRQLNLTKDITDALSSSSNTEEFLLKVNNGKS